MFIWGLKNVFRYYMNDLVFVNKYSLQQRFPYILHIPSCTNIWIPRIDKLLRLPHWHRFMVSKDEWYQRFVHKYMRDRQGNCTTHYQNETKSPLTVVKIFTEAVNQARGVWTCKGLWILNQHLILLNRKRETSGKPIRESDNATKKVGIWVQ